MRNITLYTEPLSEFRYTIAIEHRTNKIDRAKQMKYVAETFITTDLKNNK